MNNAKFVCSKGKTAVKCCILSSCKRPPMMCGSQSCQCQNSHHLCFRECKLSLILNEVSKDFEPNKKIFDEVCGYYDKILKIVSEEKQEFINSILQNNTRTLEPHESQLIELIKANKNDQITCLLLSEVIEELRKNIDRSRDEVLQKVKNGKQIVGNVERRIKLETRKIRMFWDENLEKEIKLREKLQECKIVEIKVDGKKCKLKTFQVEEITELHLETITEQVIELMAELCHKLSILHVTKEIPIDVLEVFKLNCKKFKTLGRFHTVNSLSEDWKSQLSVNNFMQVIRIDPVERAAVNALQPSFFSSLFPPSVEKNQSTLSSLSSLFGVSPINRQSAPIPMPPINKEAFNAPPVNKMSSSFLPQNSITIDSATSSQPIGPTTPVKYQQVQ